MNNTTPHEMTTREVCAQDIPHADRMRVVIRALWDRDPWACFDFALWCAQESLQHVGPDWREKIAVVIRGALHDPIGLAATARAIARDAFSKGADVAAWSAIAAEDAIGSSASTGRTNVLNATARAAGAAARCASEKAARDANDSIMGTAGEVAREAVERQQIEHALAMLEVVVS